MFKMFLIFFITLKYCESARILGIIPTPSYSHQIVFRSLFKSLVDKGHEVVVITTDPENDPNSAVEEISIEKAYDIWLPYVEGLARITNPFELGYFIKTLIVEVSEFELKQPEVQILINNKTERFDLVMVEYFYMTMFGIAEKFKCPLIGLVPFDMFNDMYSFLGSPIHPVLYPDIFSKFERGNMNFWKRFGSTFYLPLYQLGIFFNFEMQRKEQKIFKEYFGTLVSSTDINKNINVIFVNIIHTQNLRPVGPGVISVGDSLHVKPQEILPKEFQEFLDSATNGAIYFSLGTNVKSHVVPPEMRQAFLDAFRDLPYKVLWKFDIVDLPNIPENVKIVEWAPQQDILRHPNIKLFIFQGGLQSYEEAIYNKIPLVGIPFLGDQDSNVEKLVGSGYGVKIDKHNVTDVSVKEAIHEVINNPSYKQKITETSELIADQPMTGLEKAVWWTEYVLRHKGAHHLRSPVMDLPFYQYYLLDVLGFLLGCTILAIFVVYKLCKLIRYLLSKIKAKKVKVK